MRRPTIWVDQAVQVIRWEEPPDLEVGAVVRTRWDLSEVSRQLMECPGRWALVSAGDYGVARTIALALKSRLTCGGEAQTTTRQVDDEYRSYARWIPGGAR